MSMFSPAILPIVFLVISNTFMTFAWYGHLKFTDKPLWLVVIVSWSIAFVEYCFAVPANRMGHAVYSAAELKTLQEVVTLVVFAAFSFLYLDERLNLNHAIGFTLICAGAFFVFKAPLR
ncbi:DMT family protein [Magnetospira thiophila]